MAKEFHSKRPDPFEQENETDPGDGLNPNQRSVLSRWNKVKEFSSIAKKRIKREEAIQNTLKWGTSLWFAPRGFQSQLASGLSHIDQVLLEQGNQHQLQVHPIWVPFYLFRVDVVSHYVGKFIQQIGSEQKLVPVEGAIEGAIDVMVNASMLNETSLRGFAARQHGLHPRDLPFSLDLKKRIKTLLDQFYGSWDPLDIEDHLVASIDGELYRSRRIRAPKVSSSLSVDSEAKQEEEEEEEEKAKEQSEEEFDVSHYNPSEFGLKPLPWYQSWREENVPEVIENLLRKQISDQHPECRRTAREAIFETRFSSINPSLVFFPVYFFLVPYNQSYLVVLVNGQTGKVAAERPPMIDRLLTNPLPHLVSWKFW